MVSTVLQGRVHVLLAQQANTVLMEVILSHQLIVALVSTVLMDRQCALLVVKVSELLMLLERYDRS